MIFDYLIDSFPNQIEIDEKVYEVNCDFKSILRILALSEDESFTEIERKVNALRIFYKKESPSDVEKATTEMDLFIRCYQEIKTESKSREKAFDFQIDSMDIYSAFFQMYHIDLECSDMHWFKFQALFININDGRPNIMNKMAVRTTDISGMSSEQQVKYTKLKREYSLEEVESYADYEKRVMDAFVKKVGSDG